MNVSITKAPLFPKTFVGEYVFATIEGTLTANGITAKIIGVRYIRDNPNFDLEFLQANGVRLKCKSDGEQYA